jgi:hypothetical protein
MRDTTEEALAKVVAERDAALKRVKLLETLLALASDRVNAYHAAGLYQPDGSCPALG